MFDLSPNLASTMSRAVNLFCDNVNAADIWQTLRLTSRRCR